MKRGKGHNISGRTGVGDTRGRTDHLRHSPKPEGKEKNTLTLEGTCALFAQKKKNPGLRLGGRTRRASDRGKCACCNKRDLH